MNNRRALCFLCAALTLTGCSKTNRATNASRPAAAPPGTAAKTDDATNTVRNQRDRGGSAPTATDQKENKNDLKIAQEVRKAIVADNGLSTNAHNVKIIAR